MSTKLVLPRARTTQILVRMIVIAVEVCRAFGIMATETKIETMSSPALLLDVPSVKQS